MANAAVSTLNRIWLDLETGFPELTGISIQAFDPGGKNIGPSPLLPPLCALLDRNPLASAACHNDCYRKAATLGAATKILPARCYVGLSYRIVPVRVRNQPIMTLLVGRVPTQLFGEKDRIPIVERFHLDRAEYMRCMAASRHLSTAELDGLAILAGRMSRSLLGVENRLVQRRAMLQDRRRVISFAHHAMSATVQGRRDLTKLLERFTAAGPLPSAVLLLPGEPEGSLEIGATFRMAPEETANLLEQDWGRRFARAGGCTCLMLTGAENPLATRNSPEAGNLMAIRLVHNSRHLGFVLLPRVAAPPRALRRVEVCSEFLAARVHQLLTRERAEQRERECRLLQALTERSQRAGSVGELLPVALDTAMQGLQARRGSILLANPENGRITARALRGEHAAVAGTITALQPDTVSHHVFYTKSPLLVQDISREPGLERERQYPYASPSFISVPIRENGHAIGVLQLTERDGARGFTSEDLATLEKIGMQTATLIRTAKTEEEVRQLRSHALTDPLTGAWNRRHLEERVEAEFRRAVRFHQPLALAMIDLDGFRAFNDRLGQDAGDRVLREVAGVIRGQVRSIDTLGRYGGDEFVLLLPGTNLRGALSTGEKVRAAVEAAPIARDQPPGSAPLTVSIGVAALAEGTVSSHDLLHRAGQALEAARREKPNIVRG